MDDLRDIQGFINKQKQNLSIGTASVIVKDNKVLMVKNVESNYWSFPGGHLHKEESLVEGLKREVFEEIGKQITIIKGPVFYQYKLNQSLNLILFFYLCTIQNDDGIYNSNNDEVKNAKWFEIGKFPKEIYENTQIILEHFLSK
ncbi:NUDIX hydrolase [Candidatus Dojkabacteria bacterium]|nr:NUDIX hydrolase [Candidatus Dojkabacteria bacterium]